ncbi:MAG: N-6 DNA methylase [Burkholderiales bacterium]|nr:N-6 DNA methylase [Burkholderiales bacterium]
MTQTPNNLAADFWAIADLLRGDFKQSQYGRIVLPFCLLRRLECSLEASKEIVLAEWQKTESMNLHGEEQQKLLLHASGGLNFFNTSKMDLSKLSEFDIKTNLENYVRSFSTDVREIFEYYNFVESIGQLHDNLLYKIVQKVRIIDLNPKAISNRDIGLVFEELIRRFAEGSNEIAGEHFSPSDIVNLITELTFIESHKIDAKDHPIGTIYDPAAGSGSFLFSSLNLLYKLNPHVIFKSFGQELNPESFANCKAWSLLVGQETSNVRLGNTLSNDSFFKCHFDYVLSNPPFGMDWKKIESEIINEHESLKFSGRFGPGLPRVSDSSLLFVLHALNKLKTKDEGGGKASIILNRSALTTGSSGSGESEIRRFIIDNDFLEAIIALPDGMLLNTSIQTYILVLNTKKNESRKEKVQLIDASNMGIRLQKVVGAKYNQLDAEAVKQITDLYANQFICENSILIDRKLFGHREYKFNVSKRNSEFEKVPLNVNVDVYVRENLEGIYREYSIDQDYLDAKDKELGKVGYEFSFEKFFVHQDNSGRPFRAFFEEVDSDWTFAISKTWSHIIFSSDNQNIEKSKYYFFKPKSDFDEAYLKYFFAGEAWKQWIKKYEKSSQPRPTSKYDLIRKKISFPDFENQKKMSNFLDSLHSWKKRLDTMESDLWIDQNKNFQQEELRLPTEKDGVSRLLEFVPFPLSNILHHYRSIEENRFKDRYELILKLVESLSILIVSALVECITPDIDEPTSNKMLSQQKSYLTNATFGTWVNMIEKIKRIYFENKVSPNFLLVNNFFDDELIDILKKTLLIRNKTSGHGAYPTKATARTTFKEVESNLNQLLVHFTSVPTFLIVETSVLVDFRH